MDQSEDLVTTEWEASQAAEGKTRKGIVAGKIVEIIEDFPEFAIPSLDPDPEIVDGLYDKYRVFREPEMVSEHPTMMDVMYQDLDGATRFMEEVQEFVFVLKPDSDHHARVALAAYAQSVSRELPQLAEDLREILGSL